MGAQVDRIRSNLVLIIGVAALADVAFNIHAEGDMHELRARIVILEEQEKIDVAVNSAVAQLGTRMDNVEAARGTPMAQATREKFIEVDARIEALERRLNRKSP